MIYYIASYPRSGNTWVRNLILNQFGYISSPIHGKSDQELDLDKWLVSKEDMPRYLIEIPKDDDLFGTSPRNPLYKRLARFTPPDGKNNSHRLLLPGFITLFENQSVRKQLANEKEVYFVKTHNPPYSQYLHGEYVIQIVRHPGASLWSYYNYLKDFRKSEAGLSDVIAGKVGFGHWSRYHDQWQKTGRLLNKCYKLIRYEDLIDHELEYCEKLALFLKLPIISSKINPFEYYHAKAPQFARVGRPFGWETHYSREQLALLNQEHHQQMVLFGYNEPDYSLGLDQAH